MVKGTLEKSPISYAPFRDRFRLGRMSSGSLPALDLLFDSLRTLLIRDDFLEISDDTTYSGGVSLHRLELLFQA